LKDSADVLHLKKLVPSPMSIYYCQQQAVVKAIQNFDGYNIDGQFGHSWRCPFLYVLIL